MKSNVARFYWSQLGVPHRALDLGCADGQLGRYRPIGTEIHGLELQPELVEKAEGYATVRQWDLDTPAPLPFPDDHFDAVIAKDILEHLQKPWVLVREIRRVLRPGGVVMASVISSRSHRVWADYTHVRGFTHDTGRQLFADAGFSVERVWRMGPVPGSARLNAIRFVPYVLACPPFNWLWFSSWEIRAVRPSNGQPK